jgi:hypothetical protein
MIDDKFRIIKLNEEKLAQQLKAASVSHKASVQNSKQGDQV